MFELKVQVKRVTVVTGVGCDIVGFEIEAPAQAPKMPDGDRELTARCAAGYGVTWLSALGIPMALVEVVKRTGL